MSRWRPGAGGSALALAAIVVLAGCSGEPVTRERPRTRMRFTSGTPGAGFYRLGEALSREHERVPPSVEMDVHLSEGAASNMEAIQRGEADIGRAHANIAYLAVVADTDLVIGTEPGNQDGSFTRSTNCGPASRHGVQGRSTDRGGMLRRVATRGGPWASCRVRRIPDGM